MKIGHDVILVTGATGKQGGAIAGELMATGHKVRIMTRNPKGKLAHAMEGLGAEVVEGDFDDAASLRAALDGAWGVFSVQNSWEAGVEREVEQGLRVIDAARTAGVQHFVYSSVASADKATGIPHFDSKWSIEEAIGEAGLPSWTVLRPVFFMDNFQTPWYKPGIDEGKLAVSVKPDTTVQMVAVTDIGKYGLLAFLRHEELNGKAIDLAADALTMPQVARVLSSATSREVVFEEVPIDTVRQMSEDMAVMFEWFDEVGYDVDIDALAKAYGIRPTSLVDWARLENWTSAWETVDS